ncbi:MAG TPA: hypothetical protein VK388_18095 [Pyrinomonadaceae bacterium]|nr:hypothetical protein [Pyrinomonadaceae bacterium]
MKIFNLFMGLLFALGQLSSHAQKHFTNLDKIAEAIERKIQDKMPEWNHQSFQPTSPDENATSDQVMIQQWTFGKKNVRLAIVRHQSEEEAARVLRQFAADKKTGEGLQGLGDEAYVWGVRRSVAFRQGNLTIYMSAVVREEVDQDEAARNPSEALRQAAQAEHAEEGKVVRGFAQHIAAALKTL